MYMTILSEQVTDFIKQHGVKRNIQFLFRFCSMLVIMVVAFSILFHVLMHFEGREFTWFTGVYWTLTVMSTLGFGDVTFHSTGGQIFSVFVLITGMILLLIILPFIFVQLFYAPWLEIQKRHQTPRSISKDVKNHVIVVSSSQIALNLIDDLTSYGTQCFLLCSDSKSAIEMLDKGYDAVMGEHDSSSVYNNLQLTNASMLIALDTDVRNTNIVFTARDVAPSIPIVASAHNEDAIDILQLAGSTRVFQFHKLLGEALARRVINTFSRCSVISRYNELVIAEAPVMRTNLVGRSLRDCRLRHETGANVVGIWERGKFVLPNADTVFTDTMVIVIAGNAQQIEAVNKMLGAEKPVDPKEKSPVLILGYGRVGRSAARYLTAGKQRFFIVDKNPGHPHKHDKMVIGDAADLEVLEQAGIRTTQSVLITTHDDDTNIYLTLYCRRLRKDVQIISRANLDRNVGILHAAGADLVLSLASMLTNSIINLISPGKVSMINEGLNIVRSESGQRLAGKTLAGSGIRSKCGCSVVAIRTTDGSMKINPEPTHIFKEGEELYLIGDTKSEKKFYEQFLPAK